MSRPSQLQGAASDLQAFRGALDVPPGFFEGHPEGGFFRLAPDLIQAETGGYCRANRMFEGIVRPELCSDVQRWPCRSQAVYV